MKNRNSLGFSLIEVVIALGIVSSAVLILVGLLSTGLRQVGDIIQDDERQRIVSTLNTRLQHEGIEKVYEWANNGTRLQGYSYTAHPDLLSGSGSTVAPVPTEDVFDNTLGQDYVIATGIRAENDPLLEADLKAVTGAIYSVSLEISPLNPLPADDLPQTFDEYAHAYLTLRVRVSPLNDPVSPPLVFDTIVFR